MHVGHTLHAYSVFYSDGVARSLIKIWGELRSMLCLTRNAILQQMTRMKRHAWQGIGHVGYRIIFYVKTRVGRNDS